MKLSELKQHLKEIELTNIEDLDVAFQITQEGKPIYVYFNTCTLYLEDKLIAFSIEGRVVQIFKKSISPKGE